MRGDGLGQADGDGQGLDVLGHRQGVWLVEDRDVDVAGVVELERAMLAERDDEQAGQGRA